MLSIYKKRLKNLRTQPKPRLNLKMKMIVLVGALLMVIIGTIGLFFDHFFSGALEDQVGNRALSVAESVARIPELANAFALNDPAAVINPLVAPIQEATGAEFIVVGNREEIRYAHPDAEKIGQKMIGEDNERALKYGESYLSEATGSLGRSLRAKVPVYLNGEIVGVVSVGFLVNDIQTIIKSYNSYIWVVLFVIAITAIIGSVMIASYIKKLLFGLEPEQIAHLLLQKETILQSTHEGIIAVNQNGMVTMINHAAQKLLFGQAIDSKQYEGKSIDTLAGVQPLIPFLQDPSEQMDKEMMIGKTTVFANKMPIYFEGLFMGTVFTFRNKTEIDLLTKELKTVREYANALRAQTHEFANKLYMILGLLQLNKKEEAIDYIKKESSLQKKWIHLLIQQVTDPMVSGLLLGKLNQAAELNIDITIQEESRLAAKLNEQQREALLTAIGNLLDNAMDAVKNNPPSQRKIAIFLTDIGHDILFEIEDSGEGIPEPYVQSIFDQGFTSKEGEHRGFGLALTKQLIESVNGELYLEHGDLGGASFVLSIPKDLHKGREHHA